MLTYALYTLLIGAAVGAVVYVAYLAISDIKRIVRENCPNTNSIDSAIVKVVHDSGTYVISVDMFNAENNENIGSINIKADSISDDIHVGRRIHV